MSILKSKAFWAFSGITGSIGAALTYDKIETDRIRREFIEEAEKIGSAPLKDGEHERKISLLLFTENGESEQDLKDIFKKYSVDLLTKAGIDYQWIESVGSRLDKTYYELKKEKDIKEIPDGEVPPVEEGSSAKPAIFTSDNFIRPLVKSWFSTSPAPQTDEIQAKIQADNFVQPVAPEFYTDGIVAMNPGTFRSMLWAYADSSATRSKVPTPSFGMLNCEFPTSFFKRLYYVSPHHIDWATNILIAI